MGGSDTRRSRRLRNRVVVMWHPFSHLSVRRSISDAAIAAVAFALLALVGLPPWLVVKLGGEAGYAVGLLRSGTHSAIYRYDAPCRTLP